VIPLWDRNETRRRPVVTYLIFAANLALYAYTATLPGLEAEHFVERFGLVPRVLTGDGLLVLRSQGGGLGALVTPLTSMFLHGSALHVGSNLLFLHVFGDNVEDALGRGRYLAFYLLSGLAAAATQVLADPTSATPMIGASGAISGVLAAYVLLYPGARVVTLTPIFLVLELPALVFIFLWFGLQLVSGLTSLGEAGPGGGVAWFAHIGGFGAGFALVYLGIFGRQPSAAAGDCGPRRLR
jgi:membrane associated rhomboid family serine protease